MMPLSSSLPNNNNGGTGGSAIAAGGGGGSGAPPPPNPVLTAYEGFVERTPLVTRYILSILTCSYLSSWIVNPYYALANIPHFCLHPKWELYRLLLSPLVNTSFLELLFAFWSFTLHGKYLEYSMGSAAFGWLCLAIGFVTNVGYLVLAVMLYSASGGGDSSSLYGSAAGIWMILFGLIAMECVYAPRHAKRGILVWQVPVLYYPPALFVFFTLLARGRLDVSYVISMGIGYAVGFGYAKADKVLLLSANKAKEWEDTILVNFTQRPGWVPGHAATGSNAWSNIASTNSGSASSNNSGMGGLSSLFQRPSAAASGNSSTPDGPPAGSIFRTGTRRNNQESSTQGGGTSSSFASLGGGQTLGTGASSTATQPRSRGNSSSNPRHADQTARAARLQALEKQNKTPTQHDQEQEMDEERG